MVCLDTTFVVDLIRGKDFVNSFIDKFEQDEEAIYIATPVIMELAKGAGLGVNKVEEKKKIKSFLSSFTILDFDEESAFLAGEIDANLRSEGEIIQIEDIMIGSIALKNNETLITRNKKHFEKIKGLKIESY